MAFQALLALLISTLTCFAQNPADLFDKAPPDIDTALRARITQFYQSHVDGKFREAFNLVAEDSQDIYFAAEKPRCRSFEIVKLTYSDEFMRAKALVACDTDMMIPMGGKVAVKMPLGSTWKLVDGQWWWYVEPSSLKERESPFGTLRATEPAGPAPAVNPLSRPVDLNALSNLVKVDKEEVTLSSSATSTATVTVTNEMPGSVTLSLESTKLPGLELKLDRTSLNAGESATLSIRYEPTEKRPPESTKVQIVVSPIQKAIPITIRFESSPPAPGRN